MIQQWLFIDNYLGNILIYFPDSYAYLYLIFYRHLVGLWITDNEDAMNLLRRIFVNTILKTDEELKIT